MKIIFVDKPLQDEKTLEPQLIEGKLYHWCVVTEMGKSNETLQEWWCRKKEEMIYRSKGIEIFEGMVFFDAQPISGIIDSKSHAGLMIRYQWLKKDSEKI